MPVVVNLIGEAWEVQQAGYIGAWVAFTDEGVAHRFAAWLQANFDTDGIIARLHGAGNTPEDLACIHIIKNRWKHPSMVPDPYPGQDIATVGHLERGIPKWD